MRLIEPSLIAVLLFVAAPVGTVAGAPYREVFDVCNYPAKSDRLDGLSKVGWKQVGRADVSRAMARYLSLANARSLKEAMNPHEGRERLDTPFPFIIGDLFFLRDGLKDFLWLRYEGDRLDACTLLGSSDIRTDILLKEIWSCDAWTPAASNPDDLERWQCAKPTVFYTGFPDKKLDPSVIRIPDGEGSLPRTFVLQVRT